MVFKIIGTGLVLAITAIWADSVTGQSDGPSRPDAGALRASGDDSLDFIGAGSTDEKKLGRADIPLGVQGEVRREIENTFSVTADERGIAAEKLGPRGKLAIPAVPFLIRLLSDDELCSPGAATAADDDGPVPVTVRDVRYWAHASLIQIGKPALARCVSALSHSSGQARCYLIDVLGASRDERAMNVILSLAHDKDPGLRRAVVRALDSWRDERAVAPLVLALRDENSEIRQEAAQAIANYPNPRFVAPLLYALKDGSRDVRVAAVRSLGAQRDRSAVDTLVRIFKDPAEDQGIRSDAAFAIAHAGEPSGDCALIVALEDRSVPDDIRLNAARAVGMSKDVSLVRALTKVAEHADQNADVRAEVIESIASLEGARAITALGKFASNAKEDMHVRCCAAVCIVDISRGAIRDVKIVDALRGQFAPKRQPSKTELFRAATRVMNALRLVAQNGETENVRAAAHSLYESRWPNDR